MVAVLKKSLLLSSILLASGASAMAGYTGGKNTYDLYIEYNPVFSDNKSGKRFGVLDQLVENGHEFGITENQSLMATFYLDKQVILRDKDLYQNSSLGKAFDIGHKINLHTSVLANGNTIDYGLSNVLFVGSKDFNTGIPFDESDPTAGNIKLNAYRLRYEIKGMMKYNTKSGFFKRAEARLFYRREFSNQFADSMRLDLRAKFRLADKVDLFTRTNFNANFASISSIKANPAENVGVNAYYLNGTGGLKVANIDFFIGPEFAISSDSGIYVYLQKRLYQYATSASDTGLILGYSKSFNL